MTRGSLIARYSRASVRAATRGSAFDCPGRRCVLGAYDNPSTAADPNPELDRFQGNFTDVAEWQGIPCPDRPGPQFTRRTTCQFDGRLLSQPGQDSMQRGCRLCGVRSDGSLRFRELASVGFSQHWQMHVGRAWQLQCLLEEYLTRRVAQQIRATHDFGDLLLGVVDDDCKLIGEESVATPDDEVTQALRNVLHQPTLQPVIEFDR